MLLVFFVMLPFFWLAALASGGPPRVKEPWTKEDVYLWVFSAIVAILAQWWNGFFRLILITQRSLARTSKLNQPGIAKTCLRCRLA